MQALYQVTRDADFVLVTAFTISAREKSDHLWKHSLTQLSLGLCYGQNSRQAVTPFIARFTSQVCWHSCC